MSGVYSGCYGAADIPEKNQTVMIWCSTELVQKHYVCKDNIVTSLEVRPTTNLSRATSPHVFS